MSKQKMKSFKRQNKKVMATKTSNSNITFVNLTPHAICLNDGRVFEPSGSIARVAQEISEPDENGIAVQNFGPVTGLPAPPRRCHVHRLGYGAPTGAGGGTDRCGGSSHRSSGLRSR